MIEFSIAELFLLTWAITTSILAAQQYAHKRHLVHFVNAFLNNKEMRDDIIKKNDELKKELS